MPETRYGNVVIALPEDENDDPDGRFVWSDKRIHHVKKPNAHIGWAGYFKCWPAEDTTANKVVAVVLELPA
jgi:hypothetical protein